MHAASTSDAIRFEIAGKQPLTQLHNALAAARFKLMTRLDNYRCQVTGEYLKIAKKQSFLRTWIEGQDS